MLNIIAGVVCLLCAIYWALTWKFGWFVLCLIAATINVPASAFWIKNKLWWRKWNREHREGSN